jgi:hypothetical protein
MSKWLGFSLFKVSNNQVIGIITIVESLIYDFALEFEAVLSIVLNLDIAFSLKYPFTRGSYLSKLQIFLQLSLVFILCLLTYVVVSVLEVSKHVTFEITDPANLNQMKIVFE